MVAARAESARIRRRWVRRPAVGFRLGSVARHRTKLPSVDPLSKHSAELYAAVAAVHIAMLSARHATEGTNMGACGV